MNKFIVYIVSMSMGSVSKSDYSFSFLHLPLLTLDGSVSVTLDLVDPRKHLIGDRCEVVLADDHPLSCLLVLLSCQDELSVKGALVLQDSLEVRLGGVFLHGVYLKDRCHSGRSTLSLLGGRRCKAVLGLGVAPECRCLPWARCHHR